jgi:hypothetical protein
MVLPESRGIGNRRRLPAARELRTFGIAIEDTCTRSLEFQSLIAFTAAASSAAGAAGAAGAHGITAIPPKDRCTMTVETLTND